jgi:hypothetical protein
MATLILSALGTAVGGPLGGAIGGLIGSQFDRALVGSPKREGPRLKELGVSTSSYGAPIPRHHGRIRTPGTIVWATDLVERKDSSGGAKGKPSVTSYSYSVSFAVALSSRPIVRIGRVWADGNLLRGAAGDLKAGGALRIYAGHGDQPLDSLVASAEPNCPAFRGIAYCVFESLELAGFGNRIPALTFEVIADDEAVTLAALCEPLTPSLSFDRPLSSLQGFSNEGGALSQTLAAIDQLFPIACDAGVAGLSLTAADGVPLLPATLPQPVAAGEDGESFAASTGVARRRQADASEVPDALRYYDVARDYQPGMQRADGRARAGRSRVIEFPGALAATDARALTNAAAARAGWARDTVAWRMAELDPDVSPGTVVRLPDRDGLWLIDSWEWRDQGIELELRRMPRGPARQPAADAGEVLAAPDLVATSTLLHAFELPWDGTSGPDARVPYAALSSLSAGWRGAALYAQQGDALQPIGPSGRRRSVIGALATALPPSTGLLLDREASFEIDLVSPDFVLDSVTVAELAGGANMALAGGEVLQFVQAERLDGSRWRLTGLLRGRGGTEPASAQGLAAGAHFVLLDDALIALDPTKVDTGVTSIAALGLADPQPVYTPLANAGLTRRPLTPVHGAATPTPEGGLSLTWCRRSRGSWEWLDSVEAPLNEQAESYVVGIGDSDAPELRWTTQEPRLVIDAASWALVRVAHTGKPLWVRQVGTGALSPPLLLTIIA